MRAQTRLPATPLAGVACYVGGWKNDGRMDELQHRSLWRGYIKNGIVHIDVFVVTDFKILGPHHGGTAPSVGASAHLLILRLDLQANLFISCCSGSFYLSFEP